MKTLVSLFIISYLFLAHARAQTGNYNFDFENWQLAAPNDVRLDQWTHIDRDGKTWPSLLHGTKISRQSYTGKYAITIHRWYMITYDGISLRSSISHKPLYLNGFYKYTDVTVQTTPDTVLDDTAKVTIYFTKWNSMSNQTDTVGFGYQELHMSMNYAPFSCRISYPVTAGQPDSFYIAIQPTKHWSRVMCKDSSDCSFLTVDNLSFANTTAVRDKVNENFIKVYPNPAKDRIFIDSELSLPIQRISLVDVTGRILLEKDGNVRQINLSQVMPGTYFLKLQTSEGLLVKKLIVER
ncbi:MAG TPA: T9SS type A sorting domain-containing protein [Flavipsychrobacter sp.]|nr:T9SS type A sorting domain-containing protein [Flavipsychrobacter sp.]